MHEFLHYTILGSGSKKRYSGGARVSTKGRPTPGWQKNINVFFKPKTNEEKENDEPSNIITDEPSLSKEAIDPDEPGQSDIEENVEEEEEEHCNEEEQGDSVEEEPGPGTSSSSKDEEKDDSETEETSTATFSKNGLISDDDD